MIALVLATLLLAQQPARDVAKTSAPPGGAISGRVLAADGKTPLRRAIVRLSAPTLPRRLTVRSDPQGRFSFAPLPAGRFTLTAAKAGFLTLEYGQRRPFEPGRRIELAPNQKLERVDVILQPSGSISGTIIDDTGEPVAQMWVFAGRYTFRSGRRALVRAGANEVTNDVGEFRISGLAPGDYYVMVRQRDTRMNDLSTEPLGYAAMWYPGVPSVEAAQPIRVALGQQVTGIPFNLVATPTATLSGRVVDETGQPMPKARVTVINGAGPLATNDVSGGTTADESGAFRILSVRQGMYSLSAGAGDRRGHADAHVQGNMPGLTIVVGRGATVEGRIVSASGSALPAGSAIQLRALLTAGNDMTGVGAPRIAPDGTFRWTGFQGPRLLRATLPAGWWLKSVMRGETDITDTPLEPAHGDTVRDLQFVIDDKPAEVSGTVTNAAGAAVSDYTVVVFAADPARWTAHSRHIRSDRPDHTGTFRVQGLPPGDYLVAAVEFVEDGQWLDPAFLEALRRQATKVTVDPQRPASVQLVLQGVSQ